ncbi:MAG TPA: VOC family protein [Acetobacteraceae bacterium]|nr:VOC family protein [Acetobacteraceae bacterium]
MTVTAAIAQLRTTDLDGSIRFWTDHMGFSVAFRIRDFYAGIAAGSAVVHLKLADAPDPSVAEVRAAWHFHLYLVTDDAERAAEIARQRDVTIIRDLHETPWSTREFVIEDDQGHTIYVGQGA